MALLAEHKRKVKHGLDPQNMSWSNDTSKFGQRLMEKMGWEKGKGLGANENGITEHIKASYKSDTKGLGSTPQTADAWIAHQDDFNDILKMLNSQSEAEAPVEKTEKEKRVDGHKRYYGRFARGQVQTLRSTEDLDCIFGRRKSKSHVAKPNEQSATNSGSDDTEEEEKHGLTTVTSTSSVQEYFAKKMAEMKARKETNIGQESLILGGKENAGGIGTDEHKKENKSTGYSAVSFSYNNEETEIDSRLVSSKEADSENCRGWYDNFAKDNCSDELQNVAAEEKSKRKRKKEKCDSEGNESNGDVKTSKKEKVKSKDKQKIKKNSLLSVSSQVSEILEIPPVSKHEENKLSDKKKKKERKRKHKSASADIECTDGTDEKKESKKKSRRNKINDSENVIDDKNFDFGTELTARPSGNYKTKKIDDKNACDLEISTIKTVVDNTGTHCDENEKQGKNKHDSADVPPESDRRNKKKKQKRRHSQMDADEESGPVEINSKKKKKKRKDTKTNEPAEDTTGDTNKESDNALSNEHKIHKGGNKVTTDVNHSPQTLKNRERKLKKKERRQKRELKEAKQNALSNELFLGSNVADIVGYGIMQAKKSEKRKIKE